jgi:uncharacterized membrane protein
VPPCAVLLLLSIIIAYRTKASRTQLPASSKCTGQIVESHRRFAFGPFLYTVRDYLLCWLLESTTEGMEFGKGYLLACLGGVSTELGYALRDYYYYR